MAKWIIIVDDDVSNLKLAGHILSKENMRVTALRSGKALIGYINEQNIPDLILLDINMSEMDGFQTLKCLRAKEKTLGIDEIPVIFLTADEDFYTETHGFEAGGSDFIRKPFHPDVLIRRIENILSKHEAMKDLIAQASTDRLTGMLNKTAAGKVFTKVCSTRKGCLIMLDLDSFKPVNDIYGHEMGDRMLVEFSELLNSVMTENNVCGRLGGDEFALFCDGMLEEKDVADLAELLNNEIVSRAKRLIGNDMDIPMGVSLGAVFVPEYGNDYESLLKCADKALILVKQNGKHGYAMYTDSLTSDDDVNEKEIDLHILSAILGERTIPDFALQLDKESFSYVYRYIMRYVIRNQRTACKILFTLSPAKCNNDTEYKRYCYDFGDHLRGSLRKTDVIMRCRYNQYFVFLTDVREDFIGKVIDNIVDGWRTEKGASISISHEYEVVGESASNGQDDFSGNVVLVDDDVTNLNMAGRILSKAGLHVTALRSGNALLKYVEDNLPDLILLDIKMPEMDGFDTLSRLQSMERVISEVPVMFLTSDDSNNTESKGLSLGAMDYIVKPFVPDVLLLRVKHILELVKLQKSLSYEVERKTRENQNLFIHVVKSLADAIDAKDTYTNGHSDRVAEYSREIARRAGYSAKAQEDIYIIGLLHDVGKIGIPDTVINKPDRLTDEEFKIIKTHPVMGAKILKNIKEMPKLAVGARWHHERFGGGGYPDGLKGTDIPEEARIIAVADAYDAMTSRRSYREPLEQEQVKRELINGKGTQFDPRFADIMLSMIEEDTHYKMREK